MKFKIHWSGFAFWNHRSSVVVLWWYGIGVFINSPRYCRNFGRVFSKRPTPFDRLRS